MNLPFRCNREIVCKRMSAANVKVVIGVLPTCEIPLEEFQVEFSIPLESSQRLLYQLRVGRERPSVCVASLDSAAA